MFVRNVDGVVKPKHCAPKRSDDPEIAKTNLNECVAWLQQYWHENHHGAVVDDSQIEEPPEDGGAESEGVNEPDVEGQEGHENDGEDPEVHAHE